MLRNHINAFCFSGLASNAGTRYCCIGAMCCSGRCCAGAWSLDHGTWLQAACTEPDGSSNKAILCANSVVFEQAGRGIELTCMASTSV
mmetsp:Transcript_99885/g.286999  ORF Transcript_99885/g.286999 Transcript_99885/m.286999 type:complete len:88 (+) Transcript_99885:1227-1490(+)